MEVAQRFDCDLSNISGNVEAVRGLSRKIGRSTSGIGKRSFMQHRKPDTFSMRYSALDGTCIRLVDSSQIRQAPDTETGACVAN